MPIKFTDSIPEYDFAAIDVETANSSLDTICQLGIVLFCEGQVVSYFCELIDPEESFDWVNIGIHHITPEMVRGKPIFPEIYNLYHPLLNEKIVVHHTGFDRSSLNQACEKYNLPPLECSWLDTARVVRRQWADFHNSGYGLQNIAVLLGINYKAHDAGEDARAAGEILLRALDESKQSIQEWQHRAYKKFQTDWTAHDPNPAAWHSEDSDVYHNNPNCGALQNIAPINRRAGSGGKRLCGICEKM